MKEEQQKPSGDVEYVLVWRCSTPWMVVVLYSIGVPWPRGSTYDNVSHLHVRYMTQKYSAPVIAYGGCNDEPTAKTPPI